MLNVNKEAVRCGKLSFGVIEKENNGLLDREMQLLQLTVTNHTLVWPLDAPRDCGHDGIVLIYLLNTLVQI